MTESQQDHTGAWTLNLFTQTFLYDRWGNRTVSCGPCQPGVTGDAFTVDPATNRLTAKNGFAMTYDAAGNQTNDATGNRWYDGENRMKQAQQGAANSYYVYDADGRRVRRIVGGVETWMVYGMEGELLAEYPANGAVGSPQKEYGYRDGQLLIVAQTAPFEIRWLVADHLGSPRINVRGTGADGGSLASVTRHDYLPFGEELISGVGIRGNGYSYEPPADGVRQKFGTYERDNETGLDFAQARYYANVQGRFTSIDPYNIVMETQFSPNTEEAKKEAQRQFVTYLSNPQRWNRYAYTLNNPMLYTDPDGRDVTIYYRPPNSEKGSLEDAGHIFVYVKNDQTGESAYFDYWPDGSYTVINGVDQSRINDHASITIETSATQEQAILDGVKQITNSPPNYEVSAGSLIKGCESTCVSNSRNLLALGGINIDAQIPKSFWTQAYFKYSDDALKAPRQYLFMYNKGGIAAPVQIGREFGRDPRGQGRTWDPSALNAKKATYYKDGKVVSEPKR